MSYIYILWSLFWVFLANYWQQEGLMWWAAIALGLSCLSLYFGVKDMLKPKD